MGKPEQVCLTCCGESVHYPRFGDAIRLVKATGATVELISTLATAPEAVLREMKRRLG
jgi:wyosine [tRNA(Phe)-imidazoG37] synthetase (radical SAM superfamily)